MIQFKGLTKESKWVYGWYCKIKNQHCIIPAEYFDEDNKTNYKVKVNYYPSSKELLIKNVIEVLPDTVRQSTGLKDKNGKELDWWEGDVFQCFSTDSAVVDSYSFYLLILVLEDGCYWFKLKTGQVRYKCYDVICNWDKLPEKVGNKQDYF